MIGKLAEDGSNELSSGDVCHSDAACWNWALYGGTRVASRDNPDPREMMPLLDNTDKNCKAYLKQFVTMGGLQVSSANTGLKARAYFENEGDHVFLRHIELDIHRPQGDLTITKGPSGPLVASRGQEDPENEDSAVHGTTPVSVNIKWESLLPDHRAAIANLLGKDVQLV